MRTATIIIRDEVNIKVEGLELDVRKALVNKFKYDVPYARYLPANNCMAGCLVTDGIRTPRLGCDIGRDDFVGR